MASKHYVEVEILDIKVICESDGVIYEQEIKVKARDNSIFWIFDAFEYYGRDIIGKTVKLEISMLWADMLEKLNIGELWVLNIENPPDSGCSSYLTLIGKIVAEEEVYVGEEKCPDEFVIGSGIGEFTIMKSDLSDCKVGDIIKIKTGRLDVGEIIN